MTILNECMIAVHNSEEIGPQVDITKPQVVEVKYDGHTLWINVDEICRLRVTRVKEPIRFDTPGFTQREVEG